jgi:hypothetical protein
MFGATNVQGLQGVKKIKDGCNPATWMLEVTTVAQEAILGCNFAEVYRNSYLYRYVQCHQSVFLALTYAPFFTLPIWLHHRRKNKILVSELSTPPPGSKDLYFPTQYSQSFITQCMACLWKQHKSYWRNPSYTANRIFFTALIAFVFGTIFLSLGKKV